MVMNIAEERRKARKVVEDVNFDYLIMFLICMDAVVQGVLTKDFGDRDLFTVLFLLEKLCMAIFIVEMLIKMYAYGPKFFKSGWNVFDLTVITISALPMAGYLILLRTFRLFRLLKYVNQFKHMRNVINTFIDIIPSFAATSLVFGVFLYIFSVMAVSLFGDVFVTFSSIGSSSLAMLQVFTLDGWMNDIVHPVMTVYPYAWVFFLSFIMLSFLLMVSFLLNVIGIMTKREFRPHSYL